MFDERDLDVEASMNRFNEFLMAHGTCPCLAMLSDQLHAALVLIDRADLAMELSLQLDQIRDRYIQAMCES